MIQRIPLLGFDILRRSIFLILFFFSFSSLCSARDWGYSHNYFLQKSINDRWNIESRSLFTSKNNMSDVFLGVVDLGFSHNTTSWLTLGAAYRGSWFRPAGGDWGYENRPLINITVKRKVHDYFLSNRGRFEFRFFEYDQDEDVRYRNEIRVVTPFELTQFKFRPYLEDEFFYSFDASEINMNWLTTGLMYQVNQHFRVKLGYRWQTQNLGAQWQNRNVLVTGIMLNF